MTAFDRDPADSMEWDYARRGVSMERFCRAGLHYVDELRLDGGFDPPICLTCQDNLCSLCGVRVAHEDGRGTCETCELGIWPSVATQTAEG